MNKLTKGMLAGAALLVAPFTQAAVIEWSYNVTTEWLDAEFSAGNGTQIENPSLISWGADGGDHTDPTQGSLDSRSGLEITNSPAMGNVFTNNMMPAPTNTITHFNNVLSSNFATLLSAEVRTTLTLTPVDPVGPAAPAFMTDFFVDFIETPNTSPCDFPSDTVCDDIFVIQFGSLNSEFEYDGVTYFISIVELTGNLNPLPNATCAEAGVANGCLGFTTEESTFTPAQFGFLITSRPVNVPEPAMLGLFGLGLLGLRAFGRRRSAKK
ncbi:MULTISPECIES: THxN family PEP-CTERM protein [unclassified Arsukibacterium]|uniref:THxN family PEP-CTERM protein n=1 Tax=unclassified Arsukibacterium TaxID=2635278 RepID=UPI000C5C0FE7|nr:MULTISPECIES: THxN family PEP-CTERM protein [unclassified Arsukibacterium]MAA94716.1 PEP-CTERM sorting domain-containing protein [Rheinheimera sp.]MBM33733.1 PEP-CTERM sorting domain-containing protein [Rheinheimera sp.]HAW91451.1 PEP-CTERM sorting domain-containing protein [Candidatus Azambacteria bacterium]|tara:strand:+ start:14412 stop:15215 length:804 start_codon:yes stop_codon:yes gene_type:complete